MTTSFDYRITKWVPFGGAGGDVFTGLIVEYESVEYSMVLENGGTRILLSDEPYWNPASALGDEFSSLVTLANHHGFSGGVCITPISLDCFGGTATAEELIDLASRADFIVIDMYLARDCLTAEQMLWFGAAAIEIAHGMGKEITIVAQGFAQPGLEDAVRAYNTQLAQLDFDETVTFDALDFADIPDEWQLVTLVGTNLETT